MGRAEVNRISTADTVYCGVFTALIALGAFVKIMIPIGVFEVTFSLQLLFALLAGLLLGERGGFFSVAAYLLIGLTGVPIFAHGGGPQYLLRPTFGFLIGFAAAAFLAGYLRTHRGRKGFSSLLFAALAAEMVYYVCGLLYYYVMFNFILANGVGIRLKELILVWFLSTVIPDSLLCMLASMLAVRLLPLFPPASDGRRR